MASAAVRLFVLSTFRDMRDERYQLMKQAFPLLRHLCASSSSNGRAWIGANRTLDRRGHWHSVKGIPEVYFDRNVRCLPQLRRRQSNLR